jgi:hypothetical protein
VPSPARRARGCPHDSVHAWQFDLGAGGGIIKKSSVPKVDMTFDGTLTLRNSDGTHVVPSSSRNRLAIAHLRCEAIGFAVGDNMTHREDGLIGNALFQDKVVRFNLIVDNRQGAAYFRPNRHLGDPFRNPEYYIVRFGVVFLVLATTGTFWVLRRPRRP